MRISRWFAAQIHGPTEKLFCFLFPWWSLRLQKWSCSVNDIRHARQSPLCCDRCVFLKWLPWLICNITELLQKGNIRLCPKSGQFAAWHAATDPLNHHSRKCGAERTNRRISAYHWYWKCSLFDWHFGLPKEAHGSRVDPRPTQWPWIFCHGWRGMKGLGYGSSRDSQGVRGHGRQLSRSRSQRCDDERKKGRYVISVSACTDSQESEEEEYSTSYSSDTSVVEAEQKSNGPRLDKDEVQHFRRCRFEQSMIVLHYILNWVQWEAVQWALAAAFACQVGFWFGHEPPLHCARSAWWRHLWPCASSWRSKEEATGCYKDHSQCLQLSGGLGIAG